MPLPLELPTLQNWSCHNCGGCCRVHAIDITDAEHDRIVAQNWTVADGIPAGQPLFEVTGPPWRRTYRLAHQPDGACVFLDERGLCRIHGKFGEPAKPLACRLYPYTFHPLGKKVAVSLRFSCPSVVANLGRPVTDQKRDLQELEDLVVPPEADRMPAPAISSGQRLDWPDFLRIVRHLESVLADGQSPLIVRLLRGVWLASMLGQTQFDKIQGSRIDDLCELLIASAAEEVPTNPAQIPCPSSIGQTQFRLLAAQYARRDSFIDVKLGWKRRWDLLRAAIRIARGRGNLPGTLEPALGAVPFEALEQPFGPWPEQTAEIFIRYLRVKVHALHFCGPAFYHIPLSEGFLSLALVVPAAFWIARWRAATAGRTSLATDDIIQSLAAADHNHGFSPIVGKRSFRSRLRMLERLEDIPKLIAWYSR